MRAEAERGELGYLVIRQYDGSSDYEALSHLYLNDWPNTNPFRRFEIDDLLRKQNNLVLVAENGVGMVGSVFYSPCGDHAYIHSLLVKAEYRRQGIAAEILKFAQEQASADGFTEITIEAGNDELVRYYESLGFRRDPSAKMGLVKEVGTK